MTCYALEIPSSPYAGGPQLGEKDSPFVDQTGAGKHSSGIRSDFARSWDPTVNYSIYLLRRLA